MIDYSRKTPYNFYTYETFNGMFYKIINTVTGGPADSRIITYKMVKIKENHNMIKNTCGVKIER